MPHLRVGKISSLYEGHFSDINGIQKIGLAFYSGFISDEVLARYFWLWSSESWRHLAAHPKENYHFSPEEILNYSLTNGSFISPKKRKNLAYSLDQKDIINNLNRTPYKEILNGIDDPEITYAVLLQYIFWLTKKNWISNPFQIGIILDYIFFKEIEVRNLIIITEAKKIGFSTENINRYLVNV